jgi:cobalt transporter subunit CbtA
MGSALRRLLAAGIGGGLLAALAITLVQLQTTVPLILAAEVIGSGAAPADGHAGHVHVMAAGLLRHVQTLLANAVIGAGFGLLLVAVLALRNDDGGVRRGAVWGLCGFLAFALAPALGLPPELPGSVSAPLGDRQLWWLFAATASVGGLWTLAFGGRWSPAGILLLGLPHLIGAPHAESMEGLVPPGLAAHFVTASLAASAIFWAVLGAAAGAIYAHLAPEPAAATLAGGSLRPAKRG